MIGWPVLDRIGPVSPHGLGIALGYLGGSWWMLREGRKRGLSEDHVGTILLWALIGAILGARFFYVVGHLDQFESIVDMLKIWKGGISLIGGITGAILLAYPFMRRYGYRFLQVMDSGAIGLAFGIMIGRIGDLVIGDHLGKPTDFALGWGYRGGDLPGPWTQLTSVCPPGAWEAGLERNLVECLSRDGAQLGEVTDSGVQLVSAGAGVHQTALYDFVIAIGLFLFLRWLSRAPRREGVMIMSFAILYGAGRVITDFLRVDKTYFDLFTGSQMTSIAVMAISLFTLWRFSRRPLPKPEPVPVALPEPGGPGPVSIEEPERPTTEFEPPVQPQPRAREPWPSPPEPGPSPPEPPPRRPDEESTPPDPEQSTPGRD